MSDGNYNRNLLPYKNYQSGVRAGRAAERTRALKLFRTLLQEAPLPLDAAQREALAGRFKALLDGKEE